MTEKQIGLGIIQLLGLKRKANGRVDTEWGDKTPIGLVRTLKRVIEDKRSSPRPFRPIRDSRSN